MWLQFPRRGYIGRLGALRVRFFRIGVTQPHPSFALHWQVTELNNSKLLETRSGRPPKVEKLVQIVEKATKNLLSVGEQIAGENPDFQVRGHIIDATAYPHNVV